MDIFFIYPYNAEKNKVLVFFKFKTFQMFQNKNLIVVSGYYIFDISINSILFGKVIS